MDAYDELDTDDIITLLCSQPTPKVAKQLILILDSSPQQFIEY